jgi:hypothetical protein
MPDGKTFLEAGGVVDEIVDVRAEEASAFAGPFARRLSQRLIATRKTRSLACLSAVSLQFAVTGTGMGAKVQQKDRAAAAVMGGPTRHFHSRSHVLLDAIGRHHSDHADRNAQLKTQPKP